MNRVLQVHKLTRDGYEQKSKDGGFPRYMKELMRAYKFKIEDKNSKSRARGVPGRCMREGFLPFSATTGMLSNTGKLELPVPSKDEPVYLFTLTREKDGKQQLAGHALLYVTTPGVIKLEFLCSAYGEKGIAAELMTAITKEKLNNNGVASFASFREKKPIRKIELEDDSGITLKNGKPFYTKFGFREKEGTDSAVVSLAAFSHLRDDQNSYKRTRGAAPPVKAAALPPSRLQQKRKVQVFEKTAGAAFKFPGLYAILKKNELPAAASQKVKPTGSGKVARLVALRRAQQPRQVLRSRYALRRGRGYGLRAR